MLGEPRALIQRRHLHYSQLVSAVPSDTVEAPRNLSVTMLNRLAGIAEQHGGEVPFHGRLIMQRMHHAYPRECPYPHAGGTSSPVTVDEWLRMPQDSRML